MSQSVGLVIFFAFVAGLFCARVGSVSGTALFWGMALLLFINTPAGAGLPGVVERVMRAVNETVLPALDGAGLDPSPSPRPSPTVRPGR